MDVAIFIRVSTVDQAKGDSPEIHEKRARLYAESKKWNVVKVYDLAGVSGKSTRYHKATQTMLEDVKSGLVQGLVFSQLSRLARNTQELLYYADYFEKYEASLISLNESIDTSTSSGKFFYTIISALGTWERENNLDRIMASIETRRALGKFTGGQVSYGFKIEDGQVVRHQEEAVIRELMFDLFLEHRRRTVVARILNERGYRTRRGSKWVDVVIDRLLKNTDAKGIRKSNYRRKPTPENPSPTKPKSDWIFTPCPALVSEEKWEAVNAIIKEQENSLQTKPLNQRVNIFTGYIFCHNGHKMVTYSGTQKYSCPKCKVRINIADLEEVFKTRIQKFIVSEDELQEYNQSSEEKIQNKREEIELATKKITELEFKMDRLISLNIEGQIPNKGFKLHYEPIFQQKEQIIDNIKRDEMKLSQMIYSRNSFSKVVDRSKDLYNKWDTLGRPEKRFIVESVTNRVEFDGKSIKFNLKQIAPISLKEKTTNGQHFGENELQE